MNDLIPIRGNVLGLVSEYDRLKAHADRLESVGETMKLVRTTTWEGPARERYDEVQSAVALNWLRVADSHRQAANALAGYASTLEGLQRLSDSQLAEVTESGSAPEVVAIARANLDRWRLQLDSEAARAANAIRKANLDLASLRRVLGAVPPPRPPASRERILEPVAASAPEPAVPAPATSAPFPSLAQAFVDNEGYRLRLRELNAAVLTAVRR